MFYKLFGLSIKYTPIIDTLTSYDFLTPRKNQKLFFHDFSFLKSLSKNTKKKTNEVYFIGTYLIEVNIISKKTLIYLLDYIKTHYEKRNLNVIYISHRRESKASLDIVPFEIKSFPYPIELLIFKENKIPELFASFFSSSIFNLKKIGVNKIESFIIPELYLKKWKSSVIVTYNDLREYLKSPLITIPYLR